MFRRGSFRAALAALGHRVAGVRVPLHVQVVLTDRGPRLPWSYARATPRAELTTHEVEDMLTTFAEAGTTEIVITGGDPLLRADIGRIAAAAVDRGCAVAIETPGERYPAVADDLPPATRVMFHVEGAREIHDHLRGFGSFDLVSHAMESAVGAGRTIGISMTLARYNTEDLDFVLTLGESLGARVWFRTLGIPPALARAEVDRLAPTPEVHRAAWSQVLSAIDAGRPVGTSRRAVCHLLGWEDLSEPLRGRPGPVPCLAGRLYCTVDVDGTVVPCSLLVDRAGGLDVREVGALQAFWYAPAPHCRSCTATGLFDENALLGLQARALLRTASGGS